mgnify:CR=1 FL=1
MYEESLSTDDQIRHVFHVTIDQVKMMIKNVITIIVIMMMAYDHHQLTLVLAMV